MTGLTPDTPTAGPPGLNPGPSTADTVDMKHILVVDPLEERRRIVADLLAAVGWLPLTADHPWQALATLQAGTPVQLVIINGGEQSAAGLALVHHLRGRRELRHLPVLQLLGDATEDALREARRAGVSLCMNYTAGFEDLLLRLALLMGNDSPTRHVMQALPSGIVDQAVADVWRIQARLLHHPYLTPGTVHATREVLERLLSVRRDDASIEAAMALTRVPRSGLALRDWADRYLPAPPRALDPDFERMMSRCVGRLVPV